MVGQRSLKGRGNDESEGALFKDEELVMQTW